MAFQTQDQYFYVADIEYRICSVAAEELNYTVSSKLEPIVL